MRRSIILLAILGSACTSTLPSIKPYKMDVQQGNIVNAKMMAQLRPGMTKSQVKFILGTPLIQDSFHKNRWDYFYEMRKGSGEVERRRIILDFEEDVLKSVRGDVVVQGDNIQLAQPEPNVMTASPGSTEEKSGWLDKLEFWKKPATSAATGVAAASTPAPATLATIADTAPAAPPQLAANTPVNNAEVTSAAATTSARVASTEATKVEALPEAAPSEVAAPVAASTAEESANIAENSATERVALAGESSLKTEAAAPNEVATSEARTNTATSTAIDSAKDSTTTATAAAEEPLAQVERIEQASEKTADASVAVSEIVAPAAETVAASVAVSPGTAVSSAAVPATVAVVEGAVPPAAASVAAADVASEPAAVTPASIETTAADPVVLARMSDEMAESEKAPAKTTTNTTETTSNPPQATTEAAKPQPAAPVTQTAIVQTAEPVTAAPAKVASTAPAPVASLAPSKTSTVAASPAPTPALTEQAVLSQLNAWSEAWRNKQIKSYLSFYAADFKPEGLSKSAWLAQRKQRLAKPSSIDLKLEDIQTQIDGNTAQTQFVQHYSNGIYSDVVHKTLAWKNTSQGIQITQEVAHTISKASVAAASPETAPTKTVTADVATTEPAIKAVIQAWAEAWRAKNVESYLSYYADNFTPEALPSKQAWIAQRKQRLNKAGAIELELQNLNISAQEKTASASFVQTYKSKGYSDKVNKTLQFERMGNDWRIVKELSSAASKISRKPVKEVITFSERPAASVSQPELAPATEVASPAPSAAVTSPEVATPAVETTAEPTPEASAEATTADTDKAEIASKPASKPGFLERMLEKIGF